jgi:peptide/nickel transport system ATP-binding protein
MSTDDPVISIDDVTVTFENSGGLVDRVNPFADRRAVQAVDGVSLDIWENDVVALVGESGCGKTTLGKTAIGLIKPTAGSIRFKGQDIWTNPDGNWVSADEIRKSLQIVHQDPGSSLNPNQKVLTSLSLPLKKWQPELSAEDRQTRIFGLFERVGMTPAEDFAHRFPHQLSGGEKQRVALIRALLMNPAVILADEAISALDVSLRVEMMDLMLELQDLVNTSYLFISHDLSNARYLTEKAGGRIGVMYLGEIVEIGTAEQIIENPKHPYTKVLRWATPDLGITDEESHDPPVRRIDIPDPTDPPTGCRFHTRCPEARTACQRASPDLISTDGETHEAACFRESDDHEYWETDPIKE